MKTRFLTFMTAISALTLLPAQIPPLINYQGRVVVNGTNFDGTGQFKFALVDATGSVTYWSNDGTSVFGSEPTSAVNLPVSKGLYSVLLGDGTVSNMSGVPLSVFNNPDVRLRVWFNDGANGSQLLTPDQRLAPIAYLADGAVQTQTIAANAITGTQIAPGAVTGSHIAQGALDFSRFNVPTPPAAGQVLTYDGQTMIWATPSSGGGFNPWNPNGSAIYYNAGRVGLGTPSPSHHLSIVGGPSWTSNGWKGAMEFDNASALAWDANSGGQRFGMGHTNGSFLMFRTASDPGLTNSGATYDFSIDDQGLVGIGTTDPKSKLDVRTNAFEHGFSHTTAVGLRELSSYVDTGGFWFGTNSNDPLFFYTNNSQPVATIATNGSVGVGTTNPQTKLEVKTATGSYGITHSDGTIKVATYVGGSSSGNIGGWIGTSSNHPLFLYTNGGQPSATVAVNGNLGVGTSAPAAKLHVSGSGFVETAVQSSNERAIVSLNSTIGGANQVWTLENGLFGSAGLFGIYDRTAGKARLTIDSSGNVSVPVLTITGGADLAEPFPSAEEEIEKGAVVVIDEKHPGQVKRSSRSYDKRVAGIVSGANGVNPGIALHQEGALEGDQNVALSGRVYVEAVATAGPIEPGDLLTSSEVPGHAMKAVDYSKAQGAIIGKAMSPLSEGQGLVLVLVTLQ